MQNSGNSAGCIFSTEKNDSIIYAGVMVDRNNGKTFTIETEVKLNGLAKAIAFNSRNEIIVCNTDCTMDGYSLK